MEDFLINGIEQIEWINSRKLSAEERESLEGEITLEELTKSLNESNFGSSGGWDGISFETIRKFWDCMGFFMKRYADECFATGELSDTFKMGLIKIIPKKGNAEKVGDWRPITLLCCGYKIISGVIANRLEKFLMKIIGRAQKGFLRAKSIHTCTMNIMNCISQSWVREEGTGFLCVDFSKAFDSIEHTAIKNSL